MEVDLQEFHRQVESFESAMTGAAPAAAKRYEALKAQDPYEDIPPALLHAGHIASYVITCGMIEPFEHEQLTKPATYLVRVEGECRYVDETGAIVRFYLSNDPAARNQHGEVRDHVRLAPNSVCFLTLAPEFRLPAYIGARFNLLIRDVYRGLLVGTGPLVDPGFSGRLSIPIHNFTSREYFIRAGEGLVYFEFTKLSWSNSNGVQPLPGWVPAPINVQPPFPKSKSRRRTIDDYLADATGGGPPASSLGSTLYQAAEQAKRTNRLVAAIGVGAILGAVGLILTTWSLYSSAQQFTATAQTELRQERQRTSDRLETLERGLKDAQRALEVGKRRAQEGRGQRRPSTKAD
jgi:deoxycytidine triphosphate deaminase